MSDNNRISETTVAGAPPSSNGNGQHRAGSGSPEPGAGRGSPDPAHTPDRRSPEPRPVGATGPTPPPSPNGPAVGRESPDPAAPSTNGRDSLGRFTPGNPGGTGNPFARHVAELRKAMADAVPKEMLQAIMLKMAHLALEGNVPAGKFVASYSVGKPLAGSNPDRADIEELQLMKEEAPITNEVMQQVTKHAIPPDPSVPLACARAVRYVTSMKQGGMMGVMCALLPKEQTRLFELGAASPHEVCNLLRDKARNPDKPPSTNGKRKKHRH